MKKLNLINMNNKNLNFLNKLIDNNKKKEKNIYQLSPNSFSITANFILCSVLVRI